MNKLSTKEKINDVKINQQGVTNLLKVVGTSAPNLQNQESIESYDDDMDMLDMWEGPWWLDDE